MTNNWVPLHEAASRDHFACVNVKFIKKLKKRNSLLSITLK
jgi:hypothetical protein